jgi:hypothetical protein
MSWSRLGGLRHLGWRAIATIGVRERNRDKSRAVQLDRDKNGTVLNVVTASRTNADVTLRRPLVVPLRQDEESVSVVRFFADDARRLASRAREHLMPTQETRQ